MEVVGKGHKGPIGDGVFQHTISGSGAVPRSLAENLPWAADRAAAMLQANAATLARNFPNFTPEQLRHATAASYNIGVDKRRGITGNPNTIDVKTAHDNYGANVLALMRCFANPVPQK